MRKKSVKFASRLIYLVEYSDGLFVAGYPCNTHYTNGAEVWLEDSVRFQCYKDAKECADAVGGKVLKLRVSARQEAVKMRQVF